MYYDDNGIEVENVESAGVAEATPVKTLPFGEKLSQLVSGWTFKSEEKRIEYEIRVRPILDLLAFDEAMGSTSAEALPAWIRILAGTTVMAGMAFIMKKGESKESKDERSEEHLDRGSTGSGEKFPNREVHTFNEPERTIDDSEHIQRSINNSPDDTPDTNQEDNIPESQ